MPVNLLFSSCDPCHKHELVKIISNYDELFQGPTGFPPKREVEHEIYLQQDASLPSIGVKNVFQWGGKLQKAFKTLKKKKK